MSTPTEVGPAGLAKGAWAGSRCVKAAAFSGALVYVRVVVTRAVPGLGFWVLGFWGPAFVNERRAVGLGGLFVLGMAGL